MFVFLQTFHPFRPYTPPSDSKMHLPLEGLSIQPQEALHVSKEGRAVESEEVKGQQEAAESLEERQKVKIDAQKAEIFKLKGVREWYAKKYKGVKKRVAELEREIGKASVAHQETLEKQDQRIQVMADQLARTEELLATRSAELSVAQSFLSTTDRLSEAEVLDIVRDLNENIFQVAANLTEEWEKLGPSRASRFAIEQRDIDSFSRFYGPVLTQRALDRDPAAVTFLVQMCLCSLAVAIASSWRHDRELAELGPFYQRLSASGKHTSSAAGETQLTYPRGASHFIQVEVVDLHPPLPAAASFRFYHREHRGCSLDHRIVLVHSAFNGFCKQGGA